MVIDKWYRRARCTDIASLYVTHVFESFRGGVEVDWHLTFLELIRFNPLQSDLILFNHA